jgi:hypothetical protein
MVAVRLGPSRVLFQRFRSSRPIRALRRAGVVKTMHLTVSEPSSTTPLEARTGTADPVAPLATNSVSYSSERPRPSLR